jgi:hypothetical protein
MVTSPETYPVWRTRTPVVVVTNSAGGTIQRHRYRYMVVTPGASIDGLDGGEEIVADTGILTTDDAGGAPMSVMMWEDPFHDNNNPEVGAFCALLIAVLSMFSLAWQLVSGTCMS